MNSNILPFDPFYEQYKRFITRRLRTDNLDISYCIMGLFDRIMDYDTAYTKSNKAEIAVAASDVAHGLMLLTIIEPNIILDCNPISTSTFVRDFFRLAQEVYNITTKLIRREVSREEYVTKMAVHLRDVIIDITGITGLTMKELMQLNMVKLNRPTELETYLMAELKID